MAKDNGPRRPATGPVKCKFCPEYHLVHRPAIVRNIVQPKRLALPAPAKKAKAKPN